MALSSPVETTMVRRRSLADLLKQLSATPCGRLSSEAADRLKEAGTNTLPPPKKRAPVLQFPVKFIGRR